MPFYIYIPNPRDHSTRNSVATSGFVFPLKWSNKKSFKYLFTIEKFIFSRGSIQKYCCTELCCCELQILSVFIHKIYARTTSDLKLFIRDILSDYQTALDTCHILPMHQGLKSIYRNSLEIILFLK